MIEIIEKADFKNLFKILFDDLSPFEKIIELLEESRFTDKKDMLGYLEREIKKNIVMPLDDKLFIKYEEKEKNITIFLKFLAMFEIGKRMFKIEETGEYVYSPSQFFKKFFSLFEGRKEKVWSFYFDVKQKLLGKSLISVGTSDFAYILIKDILFDALKYNSKGLIIAHNHPSGDLTPSEQDILFSRKLSKICKDIGFMFLDHIIISEEGYYSMKENGDL